MPLTRDILRKGFRSFSLVFLLTAGLAATGCGGASMVERGERIQTGKGRVDAYFAEVIELRTKVKELDSDLFPLRQPLTEGFSVGVDTPLQALMEETRKRVEKLKTFGVTLSLRLSPNPTVVVVQGELSQEELDDSTMRAIQESAVRALTTFREYQELSRYAAKLDAQRNAMMDGLERAAPDASQRKQLEEEILGAGRVLQEVQNKLLKDMRTCSILLVALTEVVDTGAAEAHESACQEAMAHYKPPKTYRGGARRGGGARPPTPAATPAPAPPRPSGGGKPKKGGGDFDM